MEDVGDMFDVFEASADLSVDLDPVTERSPSSKSGHQVSSVKSGDHGDPGAAKDQQTEKRVADDSEEETSAVQKKAKLSTLEEFGGLESLPRIQLHRVDTQEQCVHEVAIPPGQELSPLLPAQREAAKSYPFILDPFQKEAILCLENSQSVLVSAHTSAGKTVVAEYAIASSLRDKQRVIYTTPIKALSNQKYREMAAEFTDVGLMTGDVTINPLASCLIMTTEILRSMLYRGSEVMREVAWVVFDEIHYMRDKERGVVWEETIILLPDNVHYVFLSATIPNASQFAEWICYLHRQPCHVVYTDYRPTPLQHYIFPAGGDGLYLVVDETGEFIENNFNTAMGVLKDSAEGSSKKGGGRSKPEANCFKIVKMIVERHFAPAIVFSFSRKECEGYGLQMAKLDLNTAAEKALVEEVFQNAVSSLSEEDRNLPQVVSILPLLRKGIGIHHSGLLPLLKETIEILFSENLLKVLFATETFAMGLNMPARTVLFTGCRKFDGKDMRWLSSGEYIQMSGRAGRRGKDDRGIVIMMVDEKMSPAVGKELLRGQPDPLNSAFHLTYNTVLNLLRVEEVNPEYMLERSFFQFQNYSSLPKVHQQLCELEERHAQFTVEREEEAATYYRIRQQLLSLGRDLSSYIQDPRYLLPFLQPGRLVHVVHQDLDFGWAPVINFVKKTERSNPKGEQINKKLFVIDVLMNLEEDHPKGCDIRSVRPARVFDQGFMQVVSISPAVVRQLSQVRLFVPQDLRSPDNRQAVKLALAEVAKRFPENIPPLDPVEDMGIKCKQLKETVKRIETLEARLYKHPLHRSPDLDGIMASYQEKAQLAAEVKVIKAELRKKKSLLQMDELKCRKRVLRRLGYATQQDVIELKGRVACEISSADELLLTELLFNNAFKELSPGQLCSLVSCFVFQEKSAEMPRLGQELSGPLRMMQETARRIAKVSREAKVSDMEEDVYVDKFKPHMMDIVYAWCNGASFAHICKMTDIFEGSIIRCMRRLEETLRQLCQAAKAIGNSDLEKKFAEGISSIKRDIVFAASLYL